MIEFRHSVVVSDRNLNILSNKGKSPERLIGVTLVPLNADAFFA